MNPHFKFTATIWRWSSRETSWHFVTLPKDLSKTIKGFYEGPKTGFGSVRVKVTIGDSTWNTSLFPDKKRGSYLLPLKATIRKAENLTIEQEVRLEIELI